MRIENITKIYNYIYNDFASARNISRRTKICYSTTLNIIKTLKLLGSLETKKLLKIPMYKIKSGNNLDTILNKYLGVMNE